MTDFPRVVVTGLGMVSPLGLDVPSSWKNLLAGESGTGPITLFDPEHFDSTALCGNNLAHYLDENWYPQITQIPQISDNSQRNRSHEICVICAICGSMLARALGCAV